MSNTISRIGFSSAEATTITIPGVYQNGDFMIIFAFRDGSTANPTIPAGWTNLTNTLDGTLCSASVGWKLAGSASETSGTWTNASGLVCAVYRGTSTSRTPVSARALLNGATNTVNYSPGNALGNPGDSWIVSFAAHVNLDTTIETAPTGLTNQTDTVGAVAEFVGHDSNGIYPSAGNWPSLSVTISGTAGSWITYTAEIYQEKNNLNNYKFADSGEGMSVTEKIF